MSFNSPKDNLKESDNIHQTIQDMNMSNKIAPLSIFK